LIARSLETRVARHDPCRKSAVVQPEDEIREIVDRESHAWDTQDVELLLSVFHPDMVWVWPRTDTSTDPIDWVVKMGRFNTARWRSVYQELFARYELAHNRRAIVKIEVSAEGDGAMAVVDVDTLWRERTTGDESNHWLGRTCKVYALIESGWKMTMHTGVLRYD
jgi:ketosteroid isomerase-like protein